jgi:hypothetical protein
LNRFITKENVEEMVDIGGEEKDIVNKYYDKTMHTLEVLMN